MQIRDLIARRTDLSTFLVHLTRDETGTTARDKLESILRDQRLVAKSAFGMAKDRVPIGTPAGNSQRVVCFTETPLEHIHLLTQPLADRQYKFGPYGVALPKMLGRQKGINPVWYLDITPGHDWLTQPVNALVAAALTQGAFETSEIAKLTPFIEQMGRQAGGYRKEFWWEREWRHVGDLYLHWRFIGLCPESEMEYFRGVVDSLDVLLKVTWVDPEWSLEQILSRLAGFEANEVDLV